MEQIQTQHTTRLAGDLDVRPPPQPLPRRHVGVQELREIPGSGHPVQHRSDRVTDRQVM